ncbi:DoxX family protein [Burkholderia cenocepacia]|uniref:DoxX family protein n=1 Tax=Burkholderia cenocepacia TaxID=95486 RepID=UPI003A598D5D
MVGVSQWFRFVTGALELAGALLELLPKTSVAGALLLACVMVGVVFTHRVVIGGSPVPALILLGVASATLWLRRSHVLALARRGGR